MRKNEIVIGGHYVAKVSEKLTTIRIVAVSPYGGWDAVNTVTGRGVRVRSAARLRKPASSPEEAARIRNQTVMDTIDPAEWCPEE